MTIERLAKLDRGFREGFLDYDQLTQQVEGWAREFPDIVRLESIGDTVEGRKMWLLTIGPEPDRHRPAVWIDGNMHAVELCGSSVALAIAEDMIGLHLAPDTPPHDLPSHVGDRLRDVLFYVLPRMSPDGAECVLYTGRYVRSVPRNERPNREHPHWVALDVDGDGQALVMRIRDDAGEFVESTEVSGLMLPRRLEDAGPFYRIYPEGSIENYDGHSIPDPSYLSDNQTDLNRNFPFAWAPEFQQMGAGSHPMSEPESRAVTEFAIGHPHLFAWLNLHTFGGVFIRPLGDKPDNKMDPSDLALFRQIGQWAEELTGYPMVSGYEEFTYEPDTPIYGDLSEFAYHQRGCVSYVVELWDLFHQIGIERKKKFVEHYTHLPRDDLITLGKWDAPHNQGRAIRPWVEVDHPQLGRVEVGGIDPRFGMWNPPFERVAEVCQQHSAAFLRVAALSPALRVQTAGQSTSGDVTRIDVSIENVGYMPTYGLSSAKKLDFNEPVFVRAKTSGCELLHPEDERREVGHLEGWGRGLYSGSDALYFSRSRGSGNRKALSYVVRGKGSLTVRVGSCRVGWQEHVITVE
jgi:hypothetical protein